MFSSTTSSILLALVASVYASPAAVSPSPSSSHQYPIIYSTFASFPTSAYTLPPVSVPTPSTTSAPAVAKRDVDGWDLYVFNSAGYSLTMSYQANPNVPSATIGGEPGNLPDSSVSHISYPTGWAGRVFVQIAGSTLDDNASLIEGSIEGENIDIDISYVQGYSAPIICFCPYGNWVTGCEINLFDQSDNSCQDWSSNGDVCKNTAYDQDCGPSPKFFNACQGFAYTFPQDGNANSYKDCNGQSLLCCVDSILGEASNCPRPSSAESHLGYGQQSGNGCSGPAQSKRDLDERKLKTDEIIAKRREIERTPVDPAEGHWFFNHTMFEEFQNQRRGQGLEPFPIPEHAFKKREWE